MVFRVDITLLSDCVIADESSDIEDHNKLHGDEGDVFRPLGLAEDLTPESAPGPIVRGPALSQTFVSVARRGG